MKEITSDRLTTAERLNQIMNERHIKQVDILNLSLPYCEKFNVKMNKSDISQYVSGKSEPSQDKLVVLGMALNVSESWLMGFDVSPARKDNLAEAEKDFSKELKKIKERYEAGNTVIFCSISFFVSFCLYFKESCSCTGVH